MWKNSFYSAKISGRRQAEELAFFRGGMREKCRSFDIFVKKGRTLFYFYAEFT